MVRAGLIAAAATLLVPPAPAAACSCAPSTPCQRWGRSTAVFVGDVVDVQEADGDVTARLRVVRAYRGAREGEIVPLTDDRFSTCSLTWAVGERWSVYADSGPRGLRASLCSGSVRLKPGAPIPDLRPEPGAVDGWLLRPRAPAGVAPWIEGVRVWLDAPSGRIESRTGEQGSFRLSGVPAGAWTVRFEIPTRETASAQVTVGPPDRCATAIVLAEPAPP